jgi:phage-related protein
MASEDYSVGTKVTADVSNFEKGMNKAEKSLKGFSSRLADSINRLGKKGLIGSVANVTLAMQGLTQSFNTVIKFAKNVSSAINECTEAYKGQVIAERALNTAIANNPFISGESSKALLQFASDMQKVTNYGDDELIPMMTNLVSLGRTESEVMQIMSVAMDMSAGMGISLDTAITQLNATLNGNIGRLGQQNAELKGLTEEELKQGKAIEILGEKFKGLSGATADTSKQLANIKGDFKEALGQFTLPSSDLWNTFWAGFYQKGIEAINKINAFMDSQIIGKKLSKAITEQIARINPADIGGRIDYTKSVLKVISDSELIALENYLKGLKRLSSEQEIILKRIGAEKQGRQFVAEEAKKEAEDKKKQADAEAQITAELQKQEEIASKKTDWNSKLLDQRIEMLETERDRAMQFTEEEGKETYSIWIDYNNKILELKLERLEKEKEKALAEEGLTAEDKIKVEEYYKNETQKIYNELGNYKKKKNEEEKKDTEFMYNAIIQMAKKYAGSIKNIFSKIANTIKDVFSKIGNFVKNVFDKTKNVFSKLFSFNVDDALTALLKVEDAILTFFVETLPRLPSFFESAFSSVLKTIKSLIDYIDWEKVAGFLTSIIQTFVTYAPEIVSGIMEIFTKLVTTISTVLVKNAPQIVNALGEIFFTIIEALPSLIENFMKVVGTFLSEIGRYITENGDRLADDLSAIVESIVKGISDFISSGGWRNILNALLTIQRAIEKAVMDNIEELVDTIIAGLPDLINMLTESIVSASKTLAKLIKPILKLIIALIKALIEVAFSDDVLDASIEVVQSLIEALLDMFINEFPRILPKMITKITGFITKSLPKMTNAIIKSLVKVLLNTNWGEVFYEVIVGIGESFGEVGEMLKDIFEDAFNTIGELLNTLWQGTFANPWLWHVLNGMADNVKQAFEGIGEFFSGIWNNLTSGASWAGDQLKNGFEWAINGIKGFFEGLATKVSEIFGKIGDGIKWAINGIIWTVNQVIAGINSVVGWTGIKINQIGYLAKGTNNAQKGLYLVGEAGPELVQFNGGERVLNNRNTNKALSEMGSNSGNTFNVTFNNLQDTTAFAMMNQLKQYNRQMAINGVI